jgi:hypothetical protein
MVNRALYAAAGLSSCSGECLLSLPYLHFYNYMFETIHLTRDRGVSRGHL